MRIVRCRVSSWEFQASQILLEIRCYGNPNLADHSNLYKFVLLKEILKHHSKYKSLSTWRTKITFQQSPDQQSKMEFYLRFWTRSILVIHILGHQIACHVRATNFIYSDHLPRWAKWLIKTELREQISESEPWMDSKKTRSQSTMLQIPCHLLHCSSIITRRLFIKNLPVHRNQYQNQDNEN